MAGELFQGVLQWEFTWKDAVGKLPVFYYDNTSMTAIYTARTAAVKRLLPHLGMRPVELYPGTCLVAFTAFEYRKTDIDPYNEFSISFPIAFGSHPIPGVTGLVQMLTKSFTTFIWQLPVTTERARVGGVDLYGYPKFIASIDFERSASWLTCTLAEGERRILTLRGKALPTGKGGRLRYVTYSVKDGIPLVANVVVNPVQFAQSLERTAASLELGDHPIATTLKGLGLSAAPIAYQYSPVNEAILFAGRNLLDT